MSPFSEQFSQVGSRSTNHSQTEANTWARWAKHQREIIRALDTRNVLRNAARTQSRRSGHLIWYTAAVTCCLLKMILEIEQNAHILLGFSLSLESSAESIRALFHSSCFSTKCPHRCPIKLQSLWDRERIVKVCKLRTCENASTTAYHRSQKNNSRQIKVPSTGDKAFRCDHIHRRLDHSSSSNGGKSSIQVRRPPFSVVSFIFHHSAFVEEGRSHT